MRAQASVSTSKLGFGSVLHYSSIVVITGCGECVHIARLGFGRIDVTGFNSLFNTRGYSVQIDESQSPAYTQSAMIGTFHVYHKNLLLESRGQKLLVRAPSSFLLCHRLSSVANGSKCTEGPPNLLNTTSSTQRCITL